MIRFLVVPVVTASIVGAGCATSVTSQRSVSHVRYEESADAIYLAYAESELESTTFAGFLRWPAGQTSTSRVVRCVVAADNTMDCQEEQAPAPVLNPHLANPGPDAPR